MSASEHYQVRRELARGGMGAILEANDQTLDRDVAMKVMLEAGEQDPVARQRFLREALVLARLEHPNIVPIHEMGRDAQGRRFYTMKLVKGRTLQAIILAIKKGDAATIQHYTLDRLLTIYRKVCDAVAFAHHHRIIHRDLKPENVMVGEFGEVLVMDWGIAKHLDDESHAKTEASQASAIEGFQELSDAQLAAGESGLTMEGAVMGSPQYMPPEQAEGRLADIGTHSDIYSLGGILYAILTLRHPVEGRKVSEVLSKVISGEITPPTHYNTSRSVGSKLTGGEVADTSKVVGLPHCPAGKVPASLSAVTMRAMALQPADRYAEVAQIIADVEAYQGGFATGAENAGAGRQMMLFLLRHRTAAFGTAAVLVTGVVLGAKALGEARRAAREGQRAAAALHSLKATAPELLALARNEAQAHRFDRALAQTEGALAIDPDLKAGYWHRAWLLLGQEKFADAAAALRLAQEKDPANTEFARLIPWVDKITAAKDDATRFTPEHISPVFEFLSRHDAVGESLAVARRLQLSAQEKIAIIRKRFEISGEPFTNVGTDAAGLVGFTLLDRHTKITSMDFFAGLPFDELNLGMSPVRVTTLEPLRGMKLVRLDLTGARVSDLSPLRGMPLQNLSIWNCSKVSDISPLQGMPLRFFSGMGSDISDLSPLRGAPLERLNLFTARKVSDLSPLAGMKLGFLNVEHTAVTDITPLRGMPLKEFHGMMLKDITPLARAPIKILRLLQCKATDYSALAGMPLENASVQQCPITDLRVFAGAPLKELNLRGCAQVKDFTPLLKIPTLERLVTDAPAALLAPLRQHPGLSQIDRGKGYRTTAEVWAEPGL